MTPDTLPPPEAGELALGIVPLGKRRGSYRYAVYVLSPVSDRMGPLWGPYTPPGTSDKARKAIAPKTWPGMVYHPMPQEGRNDELPAWHFALDFAPAGWGTDEKAEAFAHALARRIGRPVSLRVLHGWNATAWRGSPDAKESGE